MIFRIFAIAMVAAALAVSTGGMAGAQDGEAPIIINLNNDYTAWHSDQSQQQLTNWGENFRPVLSPDGNRIAYMSYAQITVDALKRVGGIGGGQLPGNIWVLNPATGESLRVADQPEGASFFVDGVPDNAVARSDPAWSPDGTRLAWTDLTYPDQVNRLMVYDFATGATTMLTSDFPPFAGVPSPLEVMWADFGIAVRSVTMSEGGIFTDVFLVYSPDGTQLANFPIDDQGGKRLMIQYVPLHDGDRTMIGVAFNDGTWEAYDPITGASNPVDGQIEVYSALAPDTSMVAVPSVDSVGSNYWAFFAADGTPLTNITTGYFDTDHLAISPAGDALAYTQYEPDHKIYSDVIEVWQNGRVVRTLNPTAESYYVASFVWGPLAWRVRRSGDGPGLGPAAVTCPGAPQSHLIVGNHGTVLGDTPNNVRSDPSTTAGSVGQIPAGGVFTVLAGPQCAEGFAWWQVNYNGLVGWTAEGQGKDYWLAPVP